MALFKAFSGERSYLKSEPKVEGYAYFCTDDGTFHIDYKDNDGNLQRKQVNDAYVQQLISLQDDFDNLVIEIPDSYLSKSDFTWENLEGKPFNTLDDIVAAVTEALPRAEDLEV